MVLGMPQTNVYMFRNEAGTIVKSFGMVGDEFLSKSTSVFGLDQSEAAE